MFTRVLYQTHRWGGVVLALFMVMWLISGLIIAYTPPLPLAHSQRLPHGTPLSPAENWLSLGEAARIAGVPGQGANIVEARLVQRGTLPLWQVEDSRRQSFLISAIDGSIQHVTPEQAETIARQWLASQQAAFAGTVSFTASLRNYKHLAPFHRVAANDGAGTELMISAVTGEVLQESTRWDRALYLAGNWLHFFRAIESAGAPETRRDVLMWSGLAATIAALTGLVIGWLRWRPGWFGRRTYSGGRTQPYRRFWVKWHFWSGLIGGTAAFLWALSGYLNGNPSQIFSPAAATQPELNRFHGGGLPEAALNWRPSQLARNLPGETVEAQWSHVGAEAVLIAYGRSGEARVQAADGAIQSFSEKALIAAARRLVPGAQEAKLTKLDSYDNYYYLFHNRDASERPLPVLRADVADADGTSIYIDPRDGRVVLKLDNSRRVYRWLFSAVHRWDIGWLYARPLSLGCLADCRLRIRAGVERFERGPGVAPAPDHIRRAKGARR
jgi:uncharacterized iron-regulated membrane protein